MSTLTVLEYFVHCATVSAALTVHQYGKSCLRFLPYRTELEPCTRLRHYIVIVFNPVYPFERRLVTLGAALLRVRRYTM